MGERRCMWEWRNVNDPFEPLVSESWQSLEQVLGSDKNNKMLMVFQLSVLKSTSKLANRISDISQYSLTAIKWEIWTHPPKNTHTHNTQHTLTDNKGPLTVSRLVVPLMKRTGMWCNGTSTCPRKSSRVWKRGQRKRRGSEGEWHSGFCPDWASFDFKNDPEWTVTVTFPDLLSLTHTLTQS